jgi:DNA-binding NarL/FixJ family response regulator
MNVKILIVDDHPLMRSGLRHALEQRPGFVLAGEDSTGSSAVHRAAELHPDLVLMDIHLPDISGLEAMRQILALAPATKIIVFSGDTDRRLVDQALEAGACGYILKRSVVDELIHAIEMVTAGKLYLSAEVSTGILEDYRKSLVGETGPSRPVLSAREKQLLRLIAEGRRNKEIAAELNLSANSIETYRARLMKKVGCSSTAELVRFSIREGIADL